MSMVWFLKRPRVGLQEWSIPVIPCGCLLAMRNLIRYFWKLEGFFYETYFCVSGSVALNFTEFPQYINFPSCIRVGLGLAYLSGDSFSKNSFSTCDRCRLTSGSDTKGLTCVQPNFDTFLLSLVVLKKWSWVELCLLWLQFQGQASLVSPLDQLEQCDSFRKEVICCASQVSPILPRVPASLFYEESPKPVCRLAVLLKVSSMWKVSSLYLPDMANKQKQ